MAAAFEEYFSGFTSLAEFADEEESDEDEAGLDARGLATRFLRRLVGYGWMNEEERADFSRIVNMSSHAKPFFDALYLIDQGLSVEYESHVIAVYSSLCGDAVRENGHHAVLNAQTHTRLLIESLKLLEQNIKAHIQRMYDSEPEVREILHIHYDIYMHEIIDKAYTRLKTSDNLSKYRPRINASVRELLRDESWKEYTAGKLSEIKRLTPDEAKMFLTRSLKEIIDDLTSIDPILEEIDDKNRRYSRISTERIKAKLYSSGSIQGKIGDILKNPRFEEAAAELKHGVLSFGFVTSESLYSRRRTTDQLDGLPKPKDDDFDLEMAETELRLRIRKQLSPEKIHGYLETYITDDGTPVSAETIIRDMESYIRLLYAAAYAETRNETFPYRVRWEDRYVRAGRFLFRAHAFYKEPTDD